MVCPGPAPTDGLLFSKPPPSCERETELHRRPARAAFCFRARRGFIRFVAIEAGVYDSGTGRRVPKIQLFTIEELFAGKQPQIPLMERGFKAARARSTRRSRGVRALAPPPASRGEGALLPHVFTLNRSAWSETLSSLTCQGRPCLPISSMKGLEGSCSTLKTPLPFQSPLNIIIAPTTGGTPVV